MIKAFTTLTPRERVTLILGITLLLLLLNYVFLLNPLNKKIMQLEKRIQQRQQIAPEVQQMAQTLLNQRKTPSLPKKTSARDYLTGLIANESLEDGVSILITRMLSPKEAIPLFYALSPLGKTSLVVSNDNPEQMEIWFWSHEKTP